MADRPSSSRDPERDSSSEYSRSASPLERYLDISYQQLKELVQDIKHQRPDLDKRQLYCRNLQHATKSMQHAMVMI